MVKNRTLSIQNERVTFLLWLFIALFIIVFATLFFIQVISHKKYSQIAQSQYWGSQTITAKRGDVLSSDGYVLAGTQVFYLLAADPKKVQNKNQVAQDLADYLYENHLDGQATPSAQEISTIKADLTDTYLRLLNNDSNWIGLQPKVSPSKKDNISEKNIDGLIFEPEPVRFYPDGILAAHVLGFVASDENGEKHGYEGVEGYFNDDLKGRGGKLMEEVDASGNPILIGGVKNVSAFQGRTIYLTINRTLQFLLEEQLKKGVEEYDAKSGTAIIMDPYSGSVLAMANYPTYDPQNFNDLDPQNKNEPNYRKQTERKNSAISDTYEPGSVIKPLTISAAIEKNLVNEATTYEDGGPAYYSGKKVDNWDGKHLGTLNITQLLQKSNNIGAAWVGTKVGSKNLYKYFSDFGLGEKTKIELEGEETGVVRDPSTWTDIELANVSFGQGFSATSLQVLNAFNTFANGGFLLKPKIVSKIEDANRVIEIPSRTIRKVLSKQTSDRMVALLEKSAAGGEAKYFVTKNYKIAGKTGTAQIFKDGKYDPNSTNATFVGFLSGDKKISILVRLQEPRNKIYASETAVPIWMNITSDVVRYYGIAPDKSPEESLLEQNAPLSTVQ